MNVCDIYTKLDDEVLATRDQWTTGRYKDDQGRRCVLGGLRYVCGVGAENGSEAMRPDFGHSRRWSHYYKAVGELGATLATDLGRNPVVLAEIGSSFILGWQDNSSWDDVKSAIHRTRERVCARTAAG